MNDSLKNVIATTTAAVVLIGGGTLLLTQEKSDALLDKTTLSEIEKHQKKAKQLHGEYVQLTKDGRTEGRGDSLINYSKNGEIVVHTWGSPRGSGYQIVAERDGVIESVAYGDDPIEVASRTYVIKPESVASTTP